MQGDRARARPRQDGGSEGSIVITLLASRNGNWQTVLRRRQRTRGIRCVSAGRVLRAIKIQYHVTRLRDSVVGERRVKKAAGTVGLGCTRGVAEDKEKLLVLGTLFNRFQTERPALEREFCRP